MTLTDFRTRALLAFAESGAHCPVCPLDISFLSAAESAGLPRETLEAHVDIPAEDLGTSHLLAVRQLARYVAAMPRRLACRLLGIDQDSPLEQWDRLQAASFVQYGDWRPRVSVELVGDAVRVTAELVDVGFAIEEPTGHIHGARTTPLEMQGQAKVST